MPGNIRFQSNWLEKEEYKEWLLKDPTNIHNARCGICRKTFSIANMGKHGLKSHSVGKKHEQAIKTRSSSAGNVFLIITFYLIRNLSCIDPRNMQDKVVSKNKMKNVVNSLLKVNRIKENDVMISCTNLMNSWMNIVLHKNLSILILQLKDWMFCTTKECTM